MDGFDSLVNRLKNQSDLKAGVLTRSSAIGLDFFLKKMTEQNLDPTVFSPAISRDFEF